MTNGPGQGFHWLHMVFPALQVWLRAGHSGRWSLDALGSGDNILVRRGWCAAILGCSCSLLEKARLGFGQAVRWPPLGSFRQQSGQLGDVRFIESASWMRAARVLAGIIGAAPAVLLSPGNVKIISILNF